MGKKLGLLRLYETPSQSWCRYNVRRQSASRPYIYAQSEATLVVKSDYNKGGTWSGATENLKNHWALTLCRNHLSYPGNKALIEKGAIPVDDDWDGNIHAFTVKESPESVQQLSLFGDAE